MLVAGFKSTETSITLTRRPAVGTMGYRNPTPAPSRHKMELSHSEVRDRITRAMRAPRPEDFSLGRLMRQMVDGAGAREFDSVEGEICAAAAKAAGQQHDPCRVRVPLQHMAGRDLNVANAGQGGHLVQTDVPETRDMLRPYSLTLQAGVELLPGLRGSVSVPRSTGGATAVWLANEISGATESQHSFGLSALTPKQVGVYVEVSRHLLLQGAHLEDTLRKTMMRIVGTALDRACLVGSGTSGEPLGIGNTLGQRTRAR